VCLKKKTKINFTPIIKILISFASGALIGDALVHLIPESFGAHAHDEETAHAEEETGHEGHDHGEEEEVHVDETKADTKIISLMIVCGMLAFFIIERLMHMYGVPHSHSVEHEPD
jgi:zinc transporter 7